MLSKKDDTGQKRPYWAKKTLSGKKDLIGQKDLIELAQEARGTMGLHQLGDGHAQTNCQPS